MSQKENKELSEKIEEYINRSIQAAGVDTNQISDGYHTFGELYAHRIALWIQLCRCMRSFGSLMTENQTTCIPVWRSALHSDGSAIDGWFVLGAFVEQEKQMTYHLPMSYWDKCDFAETLERAPEYDGHTSADVLQRLEAI